MTNFVKSDYDPIEKVVVGLPYGWNPADVGKTPKNFSEIITDDGRSIEERLGEEEEMLINILRDFGCHILRPLKIDRSYLLKKNLISFDSGFFQCFPRDLYFILEDKIIELYPEKMNRDAEKTGIINIINKQKNSIKNENMDVVIEGGNIIVAEDTIYFGIRECPNDSEKASLNYIIENAEGYSVKTIPLHPTVKHLDLAMSIINEDTAIVSTDVINSKLIENIDNLIKITYNEAHDFITNGLQIDSHNYVMCKPRNVNPYRVEKIVENMKANVITIPFHIHNSFSGGIRCATLPLYRSNF